MILTIIKSLSIVLVSFLVSIFTIFLIKDIVTYHSIMESDYETPWFENSWYKEPYTLLMLRNEPSIIYKTKNHTGETWEIKEVEHKGKKFWTILRKEK